jgi:hypothetical protein
MAAGKSTQIQNSLFGVLVSSIIDRIHSECVFNVLDTGRETPRLPVLLLWLDLQQARLATCVENSDECSERRKKVEQGPPMKVPASPALDTD